MEDGVADSGTLFSREGRTVLTSMWLFTEVICPFVHRILLHYNIFFSDQLCVLKISFLALVCDPAKVAFFVLPSPIAVLSEASLGHDLDWTFPLAGLEGCT